MPSRRAIFAAVVAVGSAVSGGATQPGDAPSGLGYRELAPDEKKVIAEAVGRVIKDPASVRFA